MNKNIISFICSICFLLFLSSCKKDGQDFDKNTLAPLSIEFDNIAGSMNLQLNSGVYANAAGEQFSVSTLQYFISNIRLENTDGSSYTVPQDSSYFLINEADATTRTANIRVPEGNYRSLHFVLGVDSLRSTMDISKRTGVLDPGAGSGMYWGWNSGYIFFKMEGTAPAITTDAQQKFRYHIGGFGGYSSATINNIKTISINLEAGGVPMVRTGRNANVHLMVDITKLFSGVNTISLAANPTVMFSAFSTGVSANFSGMFRHDHTEN
ncbi:MAG: MbnP family protein [Chitinophagaceae bacterium]